MIDLNWQTWTRDGTIDPGQFQICVTTDTCDHCAFAVMENFLMDRQQRWLEVLHMMDYSNPGHQEMMDLEGMNKWQPGRTCGFSALAQAVEGLES